MKDIFWAILKIFAFLLILPLIIAFFIAFQTQILSLPVRIEAELLWGMAVYVGLNLFIYDFKDLYQGGKLMVEKMATPFQPIGYLVPVYSICIIIIYIVALLMGQGNAWQSYFLFAISFTLTMHLVLTAHEIFQSDNSVLKSHYFLTFGVILIVNLFIISLLLAWAIPEYSLVGFFKSIVAQTSHLYKTVYYTLFAD